MNESSNAFLALVGATDFVSRSTVILGSKNVQALRASFGDTHAGMGCWHSNGALVSKCAHWAQA